MAAAAAEQQLQICCIRVENLTRMQQFRSFSFG
jgi:hypothetical protein